MYTGNVNYVDMLIGLDVDNVNYVDMLIGLDVDADLTDNVSAHMGLETTGTWGKITRTTFAPLVIEAPVVIPDDSYILQPGTILWANPDYFDRQVVASKEIDRFHRSDCKWAKEIGPASLVKYKTKEEAIKAGKKPCEVCVP